MAASDWTMQFLADITAAPVDRPIVTETTARGAAYLAALSAGLCPEPAAFAASWTAERRFAPAMLPEERTRRLTLWHDAVARVLLSNRARVATLLLAAAPDRPFRARTLRRNSTDVEQRLWRASRDAALPWKFRRQHPISRRIVDIACPARKLVIALDGGQHKKQRAADAQRSRRTVTVRSTFGITR